MFKKQVKATAGGQILLIPQEELFPNPHRQRNHYDHESLESLAQSIRERGVLQPLHVRPWEGAYQIIMGERRLRAARMAGLQRLPCIVMEVSDKEACLIAASENIQRQEPSFFDTARSIDRALHELKVSHEELSYNLGLSKQELLDRQRLLKIPKDIQEQITNYRLSMNHALLILRLPNNELREAVTKEAGRKKLSIKQTNELIRETISSVNSMESTSKILYKDIKIFTNTIDKAIETMKAAGLSAETIKKESKSEIEYTIKISLEPKEDKKKSPCLGFQLVK